MTYPTDEIPGEYDQLDLDYLQELRYEQEETHNEVSGTINSQGRAFTSKARASVLRGQVQQNQYPKTDEEGNSTD